MLGLGKCGLDENNDKGFRPKIIYRIKVALGNEGKEQSVGKRR